MRFPGGRGRGERGDGGSTNVAFGNDVHYRPLYREEVPFRAAQRQTPRISRLPRGRVVISTMRQDEGRASEWASERTGRGERCRAGKGARIRRAPLMRVRSVGDRLSRERRRGSDFKASFSGWDWFNWRDSSGERESNAIDRRHDFTRVFVLAVRVAEKKDVSPRRGRRPFRRRRDAPSSWSFLPTLESTVSRCAARVLLRYRRRFVLGS